MSQAEFEVASLNVKHLSKRSLLREKRVQFPHELVFNDLVKDGDSQEMVNFLRRQSVEIDLNRLNERGRTALTELICTGNLKCVRVLVSLGANINQRDSNGWTSLHHASMANSFRIARFLISEGADPDTVDCRGHLPVDYTDDFEIIELLTLNSPTAQRFSPENFYAELIEL